MVPALKDHISGDGPQVLEEPVCGATRIDCGLPGKHGEISCRMESEGKQVESDEDTGERFLAVSKTVLEVVSAPLEHIECEFQRKAARYSNLIAASLPI